MPRSFLLGAARQAAKQKGHKMANQAQTKKTPAAKKNSQALGAPAGTPPKAVDKLRAFMADGNWSKALSLAASWPDLGDQRGAILTAASAQLSPRFYESMGKNPAALVEAGIAALKARYGDQT